MQNSGSPSLMRETLRMAWPAVLESFFVALASMIDTLMVSSLGSTAVAAVGLTVQPKFLGFAIFLATNVAVSALVARRRGQQDRESAGHILTTAMLFSLAACAVVTLICVTLADPIVNLCGSQPDTHADAVLYFRIIMGGLVFNVVSLCINAAQRGSGNTRIAMTTNVTSSLVNMCGNYLLINGHLGFPALGIRGAAMATVLGTVVACCMSLRSLLPESCFVSIHFILSHRLFPNLVSLKSIFGLSGSILVENLFLRIGFMATAVMAAGLGTDPFAAHQVGMNVLNLTFAFGDGMQVAAVALIGRSLGEKKPDQARHYGAFCQKVGLVISCVLAVLLTLLGKWYYGLFFKEAEIVQMGEVILRLLAVIMVFQISQVIFTGCLRGAGDVRYTMMVSLFSVTIVRTVVTWVLVSLGWGLTGIWLGVLCDQAMRFICMSIRFYRGKWVELKI